jgi:hypothetical protein
MEMIQIEKYLPDTARKKTHKSAVAMELFVRTLVEANEGKLISFEITGPGTAQLFVSGDEARQEVIREFKKLDGVVVSEVSALGRQFSENKKMQKKADRMREVNKKRTG